MTNSVKIVYKNKNVIIIEKPAGMPSQKDPSGDLDAMSAASELLLSMGEDARLWLVHRLDRTVGGLIAFARNKRSAAELSRIVACGKMKKIYVAVCHGIPEDGEYEDLLFKDSATSKAYIVKTERRGAKQAKLIADCLVSADNMSLVSVELLTGRFHQIRAQFSSRGNPLIGDKKYGSRDQVSRHPALYAKELSFSLFGKTVRAVSLPDTSEYPWNIFFEYFNSFKETDNND